MNISEAKQIPIESYLSRIGINPDRRDNHKHWLWYCSPIRGEKVPSFKVDQRLNLWYDHGAGTGGSILDLVIAMNDTDITGAVKILSGENISRRIDPSSFHRSESNSHSILKINNVRRLQNLVLIEYLKSRGIMYRHCERYVKEAYYTVNGKNYFAVAFQNDKGGFELRNKLWKGSSSPKAITTIKGNQTVNLWEGFMDFLSGMAHYNVREAATTNIILNSVANLKHVIFTLDEYKAINTFFDNDEAGRNASNEVLKRYPKNTTDYSKIIYPNHKDFNQFLTASKIKDYNKY